MKVLLVEPKKSRHYHTKYPPLGLLKLAAYHRAKGDAVRFVRGFDDDGFSPDVIYVTSLFTYAWRPVHEVISYYAKKYKKAEIIVGGIYATLCPDHIKDAFKQERIRIHMGLVEEAEDILPDYSLVPKWKASLVFASRGCVRNCPFCAVKILEPQFKPRRSIKHLIYPGHNKVIFWDNNILASPYWKDIFQELEELRIEVDFNQGLDARLITPEVVDKLKRLRIPIIRLAYDTLGIRNSLKRAIELLKEAGFSGRRILVYCLYNNPFDKDTPETFLSRLKDLMEWEVVCYPMRFEPLEPRDKGTFVAPHWTSELLEMVARARRVIGYGGAFPPHDGLKKKFLEAKSFEEAFELRPPRRKGDN
uniref:Elp3/MiaA/NifB-like radical SAM core domain-containing protein n=1 Tax=candidate division WOR-3 bacterium TaxID=2052148 RepID=A0A7V3ZX84_UNCW3